MKGGQNKVIKESHFYVSDDKEHETLFVQHYLLFHWQCLCDQGVQPCAFLDGCASQFKGAQSMLFVAKYLGLINGYKMKWQYFGTSHGKGMYIYFLVSMP
jgi:hypothetical protein